jgi:hypothetical protein
MWQFVFLNLKNPFVGFAGPFFFGRQVVKIGKRKNTDGRDITPTRKVRVGRPKRVG